MLAAIDFNYFLETYGYIAILIGTFLEGETIVIIAGFLAHKDIFNPVYIALCAFTGSFISDQLMFSLGRYKGMAVLNYFPRIKKNVRRANFLISKYETILILGFRFIYGVRNATPILLGAGKVHYLKFLTLNFIGGAIWAISFTAGGYYMGEAFSRIKDRYGPIGLVVFLAIIGILTFSFIRYRKKRSEEKKNRALMIIKHKETQLVPIKKDDK